MARVKVKPVLSYTLLCDDVRQELGGKFSLMGLFESIYSGSFPAVHPRFAIVNEWTGGKGEFLARIRLLGPDKAQVLSESESKLVLYSETQRHRDIAVRFNTTFPAPGTYWVEILLDNERISLVPLSVQQAGQQQEMVH
jgi:hypothetical protein